MPHAFFFPFFSFVFYLLLKLHTTDLFQTWSKWELLPQLYTVDNVQSGKNSSSQK